MQSVQTLPAPSVSSHKWPLPSPRVQALMRQGAELVMNAPPEWVAELDEACLTSENAMRDDPVLVAATKRANRSGLAHWAAANIERPGAFVPRYVSSDMASSALELARRGLSDALFNSTRAVQNAAWQRWQQIAFALTSDPAELQALLDVSARSISAFIDANMAYLADLIREDREAGLRGTHADRRELVTLILDGTDVTPQHASQRLGYALDQVHHAAVIWSEEADVELRRLEKAAETLALHADTRQILTVMVNAGTLWVWTHGGKPIDMKHLQQAVKALTGVRMAIGSSGGHGIEGFRRGHLDALSTQRLMSRLQTSAQVVGFNQIRLVSLMMQNMESARQFIAHTLGELATADPALRKVLHTFLESGCNAKYTAEVLHLHRNTFLRRLARAEELLPRPLADSRVHVAAALEVLNWSDAQP